MGKKVGIGAQFTLSLATQYTVPEVVRLAEEARKQGIERIWVNDNLRYRNTFVALAAIASKVKVKLGTAVAVPYFRNPWDLVDSIATLSEMAVGDLAIGLARGSTAQAGHLLELEKPITMMEEVGRFASRALAGERIEFADFPFLTGHFHMNPRANAELSFMPKVPVHIYCGGNAPKVLEVAGRTMDGVLFGGYFEALVALDKVEGLVRVAEDAAKKADPAKRLKKVAELNISVSQDAKKAREDARKYASHSMMSLKKMGVTEEEFERLHITTPELEKLERAFGSGMTIEEMAPLVTDAMIDAVMVAGDLESCKERIIEYYRFAASSGFDEVAFAKLGPDYDEAIGLIGKKILPDL